MHDSDLANVMLESAISVFEKHKMWADQAIGQLAENELRQSLDENTNSIAVIMKHVAGNLISRWTDFLTTDGEKPWRNRDDEFGHALAGHLPRLLQLGAGQVRGAQAATTA